MTQNNQQNPFLLYRARQRSPNFRWAVSAIVSAIAHLALILIFAHLIFLARTHKKIKTITFDVNLADGKVGKAFDGEAYDGTENNADLPDDAELDFAKVTELLRSEEIKDADAGMPDDVKNIIGVKGGIYSRRAGQNKMAVALAAGGSATSEAAVTEGLKWLARHQDDDGKWDSDGFTKHCGEMGDCEGAGQGQQDVAVTGLSLLAFLGAGHTHQRGEFKEVVQKGLDYLDRVQADGGCFGSGHWNHLYGQGIATLAVAEAYAMTRDEKIRHTAQAGVSFIAKAQQRGGGWNYNATPTSRNDTSVTGWQIMALKSARAGNLYVPWETVYGAIQHLENVTEEDGSVSYTSQSRGGSIAMTAVGMFCRQLLGWKRTHPLIKKQARILSSDGPDWGKMSSGDHGHSMYYWYYGTLAMYQMGGDYWESWNLRIRDMLIEHQRKEGHARGSWNPVGRWGGAGGRIYSTALCTLDLEVYYRYLPLYEISGSEAAAVLTEALKSKKAATRRSTFKMIMNLDMDADMTSRIRAALVASFKTMSKSQRLQTVLALSEGKGDAATAVLEAALKDEAAAIRIHAVKALAKLGNRKGVSALMESLKDNSMGVRTQAVDTLAQLNNDLAVPGLIEALADPQPFIAARAIVALRRIVGQEAEVNNLEFNAHAPSVERQEAAKKWKVWWEERK